MLFQEIDVIEWIESHPLEIWGTILGIIALNAGLAGRRTRIQPPKDDEYDDRKVD